MRLKDPTARAIIDSLNREPDEDPTAVSYAVVEKSADKRVTVGVVYLPDVPDAHGEYAEADELEKAIGDYLDGGDLKVRRQHGDEVIGQVVGVMAWPFEQEVELKHFGLEKDGKPMEYVKKAVLPAGTVYSAVQWTEQAWPDVKSGAIRGYSMGGAAVRIKGDV